MHTALAFALASWTCLCAPSFEWPELQDSRANASDALQGDESDELRRLTVELRRLGWSTVRTAGVRPGYFGEVAALGASASPLWPELLDSASRLRSAEACAACFIGLDATLGDDTVVDLVAGALRDLARESYGDGRSVELPLAILTGSAERGAATLRTLCSTGDEDVVEAIASALPRIQGVDPAFATALLESVHGRGELGDQVRGEALTSATVLGVYPQWLVDALVAELRVGDDAEKRSDRWRRLLESIIEGGAPNDPARLRSAVAGLLAPDVIERMGWGYEEVGEVALSAIQTLDGGMTAAALRTLGFDKNHDWLSYGGFDELVASPPRPNLATRRTFTAAARRGDAAEIARLIEAGVTRGNYDLDQRGAIDHAIDGGHAEVVRLLHGYEYDSSAVAYAAALGLDVMVDVLLELESDAGLDLALDSAIGAGHRALVERLVPRIDDLDALYAREIDPYSIVFAGLSPLDSAALAGDAELVALLIAAGANADALYSFEGELYSPAARAAERGHVAATLALVDAGARLHFTQEFDYGPEHIDVLENAARRGSAPLVAGLLERGATDPESTTRALLAAAEDDRLDVLDLLLAHGVDPNATDEWSRTALALALESGAGGAVERLLTSGAAFDAEALFAAASSGSPKLLARVLDSGLDLETAHVSSPDAWEYGDDEEATWNRIVGAQTTGVTIGAIAVETAALNGNTDAVELLLAAGAPITVATAQAAFEENDTDLALLLIDGGFAFDAPLGPYYSPRTALHQAAGAGNAVLVEALLEAGADPDVLDEDGTSALGEAIRRSNDSEPVALFGGPDFMHASSVNEWESRSRSYAETVTTLVAFGADLRGPTPVIPTGLLEAFDAMRAPLAERDVIGFLENHVDPETLEKLVTASKSDDIEAFAASEIGRRFLPPLLAWIHAVLAQAGVHEELWTADLPVRGVPRLLLAETSNSLLTPSAYPRFEYRNTYRVDVMLPDGLDREPRADALAALVRSIEATDGVRAATIGAWVPFIDPAPRTSRFVVPGSDQGPIKIAVIDVSPAYFERMAMHVRTGSAFDPLDGATPVVVTDQVGGNHLYEHAPGHAVKIDGEPYAYGGWLSGLDDTSWSDSPASGPRPAVAFRDAASSDATTISFLVDLTAGADAGQLADAVAAAVTAAVPGASSSSWRSLEDEVHALAYPAGLPWELTRDSTMVMLLADGAVRRGDQGLGMLRTDDGWKLVLPGPKDMRGWFKELALAPIGAAAELPFMVVARTNGLLSQLGDFESAQLLLEQFVDAPREPDALDPMDLYIANIALGNCHMSLGRFDEARTAFERAIDFGRASRNFEEFEWIARNNLVTLAGLAGDTEAAQMSEAALVAALERAMEELDLDDRGMLAKAYGMLVQVHANLANWQTLGGRFEAARTTLDTALDAVRRAEGAAAGSARYLRLLEANYYLFSGQVDAARILFEEILASAERRSSERDRIHAFALTNLAMIDESEGRLDEARERRSEAARRIEALSEEGSPDLGLALLLEGESAARAGDAEAARALLVRAGTILDATGSNAAWLAHLAHGTLEAVTGDTQVANEQFDLAEVGVRSAFGVEHRHFATFLAARALLQLAEGDADAARDGLVRAIEIVEAERGQFRNEFDRREYLEQVAGFYSALTWINLERGDVERAFESVERGKAKTFVELLAARSTTVRDGPEGALLQGLSKAETDRRLLDANLESDSELGGGGRFRATAAALATQSDRRGELATKRVKLLQQLRELNPVLASAIDVDAPESASVRAALADDEALIEFFELAPATFGAAGTAPALMAFVVTRGGVEVREVAVDAHSAYDEVEGFVQRMLGSDRRRGGFETLVAPTPVEPDATRAHSERLYGVLLQPLEDLLDVARVTIVPNGALHYLPFAALHDGERWLSERFELATAPSAGTLVRLRARGAASGKGLLALADPDGYLGRLAGAKEEVEAIAPLFERATVRPGAEATESSLRSLATSPRILHVAGHGVFDGERPELSHLALAPSAGDDGRLEVHEVYGLPLGGTEIVVLSACSTGVGVLSGGDEIVGLSRAFFVAGARTVVSSLWDVSDSATKALMTRFYAELVAGAAPAAALQRAQAELRADPATADPFFWSAFQVSGLGW